MPRKAAPAPTVHRRPRRPPGTTEDPVRSVRISDEVWAGVRTRAQREGVTMSYVLLSIAEGYAAGEVDLPQVVRSYRSAVPNATIVPSGKRAARS
jgi:hypothetical protein